MAEAKAVSQLDRRLIDEGTLSEKWSGEYSRVHKFLNGHIHKTGKILSEETFQTGNAALRQWLLRLYRQGASQEKLTAFLRCGLAHLSFDYIESTYEKIPLDDLIARTLISLKKRKFTSAFFRAAEEARSEREFREKKQQKAKKAAAKKKAAKKQKKDIVKRTAEKPAKKSKKKTTKKTTKKSKKAVKKSAKKTAAKKSKKVAKKKQSGGFLGRLFGGG